MRIVCFSTHSYDRDSLQRFNAEGLFAHDIVFLEAKLTEHTVLREDTQRAHDSKAQLAVGAKAVCIFVNDICDAKVIQCFRSDPDACRGVAYSRTVRCEARPPTVCRFQQRGPRGRRQQQHLRDASGMPRIPICPVSSPIARLLSQRRR